MLRRLLGAIGIFALLVGKAHAQLPFLPYVEEHRRSENALQQAETERQHRAVMKNIPDRKASNDPWQNVRSSPAPDRHRVE